LIFEDVFSFKGGGENGRTFPLGLRARLGRPGRGVRRGAPEATELQLRGDDLDGAGARQVPSVRERDRGQRGAERKAEGGQGQMRRGAKLPPEQRSPAAAARGGALRPRRRRLHGRQEPAQEDEEGGCAAPVLHARAGARDHSQGPLYKAARDHQSLSRLTLVACPTLGLKSNYPPRSYNFPYHWLRDKNSLRIASLEPHHVYTYLIG
jgi:hypothetical protein